MPNDSSSVDALATLAENLRKQGLPSYARPCFVRLTNNIEWTGEFDVAKK